MLEVRNMSLSYDNRSIFSKLSFKLVADGVYGILGPSGVGKSSLLHIIAGLQDPLEGEIILNGQQLPRSSQRLVPGFNEIALVASTYNLDWNHTSLENIRESILGWPTLHREKRVQELLNGLLLGHVKNTQAKYLSEGEKQRLSIARAISNFPQWLLLDEPLGHLDFVHKNKLLSQLFHLGIYNVLVVSHNVQDLMGVCHKMAVFNTNGKLSKFEHPNKMYYNLRNTTLARLMGPVNTLVVKGVKQHFRPNDFILSVQGVEVRLSRTWFNGMVYVHQMKTLENNEIVLYNSTPLPSIVKILPNTHETA